MPRKLKKRKDENLGRPKVSEQEKVISDNNPLELHLESLKASKTSRHSSLSGFFTKKDSSEYQAVVSSLESVVMHTRTSFNEDFRSNLDKLKNASNAYLKLIDSCETYLSKSGGKSESGQARKDKVREILGLARQDLHGIHQYYGDIRTQKMSEKQQEMLTWKDILHDARTETFEMDDFYGEKDLLGNGADNEAKGRKFKKGVFFKENIDKKQGNLTNRNVAYGRIANLIGTGGVVEQSKQVKVHDKTTNEDIQGIMMTWAKGKEGNDVAEEIAKEIKDKETIEDKEKAISGKMDPLLQKELCSLQVLDYLCDQGDRHLGNFFVEEDQKTGMYSHVHGIDHDHSFYEESQTDTSAKRVKEEKGKDRMDYMFITGQRRLVVNADGELCIPHMDKKLANNIKSIRPSEIEYVLADLLEQKYIEPVVERLKRLQNAIKKAEATNPGIFLEDKDWGEESHKNLLKNSIDYQAQVKERTFESSEEAGQLALGDNYYARFYRDIMRNGKK